MYVRFRSTSHLNPSCNMGYWCVPVVFVVLALLPVCSGTQLNLSDVNQPTFSEDSWADPRSYIPMEIPSWTDFQLDPPQVLQPGDVTTITIANTTVGLCSSSHFCNGYCGSAPPASFMEVVGSEKPPLCHCDQACVFYDDCCQDYAATCEEQAAQSPQIQDSWTIKLDSFACVSSRKVPQATYRLVTVCPEDADAQTAVSCEEPSANDSLAAIPCYSKNSGVHFRNVYCALCHGEKMADVVPWEVVVNCGMNFLYYERAKELLQSSITNLDRIEQELECVVTFKVPEFDDVTKAPRLCYPEVKGHCATQQDPLGNACASYTALTLVANHKNAGIFRNPHCALCNLPSDASRVKFATDCREDLPLFYLSGMFTTDDRIVGPVEVPYLPPPISLLFDFRASSDVKIVRDGEVLVSETVQCPRNEAYDPFDSRCRRLSCPQGYLLQDDQCAPDIKVFGQGCGEAGDDNIVLELTVTLGDCWEGPPKDDENAHRIEDIQLCLEDFFGFEQGTLQATESTTACLEGSRYSFFAIQTDQPLKNFQGIKELAFPATPYCHIFYTNPKWTVELNQNCQNLPRDKCTGRWLNDTQVSLPVQNGTTLVYVNASASWYALNQTIIRAHFQRQEESFEQLTHVQICAEPTLTCPLMVLNSSVFHLNQTDPGTIIHNHTGRVFKSDEYIRTKTGEIQVCSFFDSNGTRNGTTSTFFAFSKPQQILSLIGNIISMTAAAVTFVIYCAFKELRQRISLAIMSLVACLLMAQLLLLVSGAATSNSQTCTAVAVLGHFFWLATVLWTSVLAFDLNQTFAYSSKIRRLDSNKRIYLLHATFSFGGAFLIILPCLVLHLCGCTDLPLWYGSESVCWIGNGYVNLVAFGVPIGLVVIVNGVLFAFIVRGIRSTNKQSNRIKHTEKTELQKMKQELVIYIKISSLMGFTWIFGFAAAFSDVMALWYIFIILNSCQGLLIFLSFVCNKKVWRLWRNLLCGRGTKHKGSSSTPSALRPMLKHRSGINSSDATHKTTKTEL